MRWLYLLQQKVAITRSEFSFLAVMSGLLLLGMGIRYFNESLKPLPPVSSRPVYTMPSETLPFHDTSVDSIKSAESRNTPPEKVESRPNTLDVNRATAQDLESLPQIGPVLAKAIVSYRTLNGPFRRVDDLINVKGIGKKKLARIRPYLYTQPAGE